MVQEVQPPCRSLVTTWRRRRSVHSCRPRFVIGLMSQDVTVGLTESTEVAGYAKVRLWMASDEKNDMDVVVQIRKIDKAGSVLKIMNFPSPAPECEAPEGEVVKTHRPQRFLRAAHLVSRDDAQSSSDGQQVFYKHDREEKIPPGMIVPLDITLLLLGSVFAEGEGIRLSIAGHLLSEPVTAAMELQAPDDENLGQHRIHTGDQYDSRLILPVVADDRA